MINNSDDFSFDDSDYTQLPDEKALEGFLEPDEFTIYVEGKSDVKFLDKYIKTIKGDTKSQISIQIAKDAFSVSFEQACNSGYELLRKYNCDYVILSSELYYNRNSMFLVDRDVRNSCDRNKYHHVTWTDYPAIESYFAKPDIINQYIEEDIYGEIDNVDTYFDEMMYCLNFYYGMRYLYKFEKQYIIHSVQKIKNREDLVNFDFKSIVESHQFDKITRWIHLCVNVMGVDSRCLVYGHDLAMIFKAVNTVPFRSVSSTIPTPKNEHIEFALMNKFMGDSQNFQEELFNSLKSILK